MKIWNVYLIKYSNSKSFLHINRLEDIAMKWIHAEKDGNAMINVIALVIIVKVNLTRKIQ